MLPSQLALGLILSIFVSISIYFKGCEGIINKQSCTHTVQIFQWKESDPVSTIQVNHWSFWRSVNHVQILAIALRWLFIITFKGALIAGLWYLLEHHTLVIFESTQSFINQLEFDQIIGLFVNTGIWTSDPASNHQAEILPLSLLTTNYFTL